MFARELATRLKASTPLSSPPSLTSNLTHLKHYVSSVGALHALTTIGAMLSIQLFSIYTLKHLQ